MLAGLFTAQPADFGLQLADSLFGGDAGVGFLVKLSMAEACWATGVSLFSINVRLTAAEMSPAWSAMVSDGDTVDATGHLRVGGLSASMYLLTVTL